MFAASLLVYSMLSQSDASRIDQISDRNQRNARIASCLSKAASYLPLGTSWDISPEEHKKIEGQILEARSNCHSSIEDVVSILEEQGQANSLASCIVFSLYVSSFISSEKVSEVKKSEVYKYICYPLYSEKGNKWPWKFVKKEPRLSYRSLVHIIRDTGYWSVRNHWDNMKREGIQKFFNK